MNQAQNYQDAYGTAEREENMAVMSEPARGCYTMDDEHYGKVFIKRMANKMNLDRRTHPIRRFFYHFKDDFGLLGFTLLWFAVGVAVFGLWVLARTK